MISTTLRHFTKACSPRHFNMGRRSYHPNYNKNFMKFTRDVLTNPAIVNSKIEQIMKQQAASILEKQQISGLSNTAYHWGEKGVSLPLYSYADNRPTMEHIDQQRLMEFAITVCNNYSTPVAIRELGGWNGLSIFYIYSKLRPDCGATASMLDINPRGVMIANAVSQYLEAPSFKAFHGNCINAMPPINPDAHSQQQVILASRILSILSEEEIDEMMHNISQQLGELPGKACLSFPLFESDKIAPQAYQNFLKAECFKKIPFTNELGFSIVIGDRPEFNTANKFEPGVVYQTFIHPEKAAVFFERYNLKLIRDTTVHTSMGYPMGIAVVERK